MTGKNELKVIDARKNSSDKKGSSWLNRTMEFLIGPKPEPQLPAIREKNTITKVEEARDSIILDDKVQDYIDWYKQHMVIGHYTDIGEYHSPREMQNFIEKMATWYELRYPDYEINRMLPCTGQESTNVSEEMFKNNSCVKDLLDEDNDIKYLDWSDFYNFEAFYKSLPAGEKHYFSEPMYPSLLYYDPNRRGHIHLENDGTIISANGIPFLDNFENRCNKVHIKDVVEYISSSNIPYGEEFREAITRYEDSVKSKEGMLDAVMYRIIERGGNRFGPRRAFLFAREFKRDLSIPMIYGYDSSDPGMRKFMNAYFKAGGNPDISCIVNYFSRAHKYEELSRESMRLMIRTNPDSCAKKYTEEEDELHQRLTSILAYHEAEKIGDKAWMKYLKMVNKPF